ncbi:SpoIIE family protein phosphatase [Lysobacter sp. S4-A87]|uniref:SpoIIE family protein phosphatase n=1 Tax=Lysobacter sp. S4-A87 TaxID=2925843 RepID=UPI001F53DAA0|nr:SpoIIE family protein phosphatase [Lysobacter sp. S4-A87]UNK48017.1 SpoIIE family protein phosphatase [Lysobacter sp. S4-A87]
MTQLIAELPASGRAVPWYRSLRTRLVLWICLGCVAVLVGATLVVQARSAQLLTAQSEREIRTLAEQTALGLHATLESVQVGATTLGEAVRGVGREPRTLDALLRATVAGDDDIEGAMLILEPGALDDGDAGYSWYVRREGKGFYTQPMRSRGYDYHDQPWWKRTIGEGRAWWSEPYRNAATGDQMFVTYNRPIRRNPEDLASAPVGMVSLDVPVSRLRTLIGQQSIDSPVLRIVLSPEHLYVVHPSPELELKVRLDDRARQLDGHVLQPLLDAVRERRSADVTYLDPTTHIRRIGMVQPVPDSAWTVAVSVSEQYAQEQLRRTTRAVIAGGLLAVLVLVLVLWLIARPITRPLLALTSSAGHFAAGEFDWPLPHTTRRDEVGLLARAYDRARSSIKSQLAEIERMARSRQKLESELSIARDIQLAMLPPAPTLHADGHCLQAHALLEPAKAVGGDFYTFFVRDERVLWFVIGDVSDKGVPAALFMARAMTVLEIATGLGGTPDRALRAAAARLVEGNDTCMFATVLCGAIDSGTGEMVLASAGHEAPVLLRAGGRRQYVEVPTGPPLGVDIADSYPLWRGRLQPGDALVAYTDGISEALDGGQNAFGTERLLSALPAGADAKGLCEALVAAAHGFADGAAQSDDITVLALSFDPSTGGNA